MAVHMTRRLAAELRGERTVTIRVRSSGPADVLDAAMADLRGLLYALGGVGGEDAGPAYVSAPVTVPDGRLLMVDFGRLSARARRDLPIRLTALLERHGVTEAVVDHPPEVGERYETLRAFRPVVRTWLRWDTGPNAPRIMRPPPADAVDLALDWLWRRHRPTHQMLVLVFGYEVPLTRENHRAVIDAVIQTQPATTVHTTDFTTGGSMVLLGEYLGFGVTLATAVPSPGDLAAHMREQRDLIREHATRLSWAGITVLPDDNLYPGATHRRYDQAPATPMWYQLLTSEQLARLGDRARARTHVFAGRTELELDGPEPWIPTHPDHRATLDNARRLLRP